MEEDLDLLYSVYQDLCPSVKFDGCIISGQSVYVRFAPIVVRKLAREEVLTTDDADGHRWKRIWIPYTLFIKICGYL